MIWKVGTILLGVLLLVLQFRLWVGPGSLSEISALHRDIEAQQTANRELTTRNRVLEVEVADLKDGLDTVEEIAREELGMIREGETYFLLVEHE